MRRRRAAKLVTDAAELLQRQLAPSAEQGRSIARDLGAISDSQVP